METKQKYTVMVNHDEYVKGVFDTVKDADAFIIEELKANCSEAEINGAEEAGEFESLADGYGYRVVDLVIPKAIRQSTMKLVNINVSTNYRTTIQSRFLATETDIENHRMLIGEELNFGEYEGKHSEVEGSFNEEDMTIQPLSEDAVQAILDNVGKHISGVNLFDYYEVYEHYFETFFVIRENLEAVLSEKAYKELEERISRQPYAQKRDGKYSEYLFINQLEACLPIKELKFWSDRLGDEYEDVAKDLPEDIKNELTELVDRALF